MSTDTAPPAPTEEYYPEDSQYQQPKEEYQPHGQLDDQQYSNEDYAAHAATEYGSEEHLQNQQAQQQQLQHQYTSSYPEDDTFNIFVGDLKSEVNEMDLMEAFRGCGEINSVHIFRDPHTNEQKGFGFVHFKTREGQERALTEEFNHVVIKVTLLPSVTTQLTCQKGRPCRVSISEQKNTLFVGNLPVDMNQEEIAAALTNVFGPGADIELKTGPPPAYESRGFCFAQFTTHQRAEAARKLLLQATVKGRPLNVSWAESRFQKVKVCSINC
jgi:RNA recognition motif-containing protein